MYITFTVEGGLVFSKLHIHLIFTSSISKQKVYIEIAMAPHTNFATEQMKYFFSLYSNSVVGFIPQVNCNTL